MSTDKPKSAPAKKDEAEATRKRRRNTVVAGGVVAAAVVGAILLFSGDANADVRQPGAKKPSKTPKGGKGGGKDQGGSRGPGGKPTGPDEDPLGPDPEGPSRVTPGFKDPNADDDDDPDDKPAPPDGPNPDFDELDPYYSDEYPDPGKFYQVRSSRDGKGLLDIAQRWAMASLFLAARNAGGLSVADAQAWASERKPKGAKLREWADYILCVAQNDILYGSFRVEAKNHRGPHTRGIDLVPQHADNWQRMRKGQPLLRNVYMHPPGPGELIPIGTPSNAGRGDKMLPLLWMPRLNDKKLWTSGGTKLLAQKRAWADQSSAFHPPPKVRDLHVDDVTNSANLGAYGCKGGNLSYG